MASIPEMLGRLHPVLLHFPLALLVLGAALELARWFRESAFLARAVVGLFAVGAVAAILAAGSGWLLAAHEHIRSDQRSTLELHRWFGIATAAWAVLAWLVAQAWKETTSPGRVWGRRLVALTTLVLIIAAGHFGAVLIWGGDWFTFNSP